MPTPTKSTSSQHAEYLNRAIQLACDNAAKGQGPFGAVIVMDGKVIAEGVNQVLATNDPTAHAEIVAIRKACQLLGTYDLKGAILYSSCEPCPMCLGSVYWARLSGLFYAATRYDAAEGGFGDALIYSDMSLPLAKRMLTTSHIQIRDATAPFSEHAKQKGKIY